MSYKLTYFDIKGRGEPIRMIFALAKVKFTDVRIQFADWPALKPTLKWGQMPILKVGDKELSQSGTILRFLARKFKLAGADEWEATRCEELYDAITDFNNEVIKYEYLTPDPEKKAELKTVIVKTLIPKFFGKINTMQHENGGTWLVGKTVTWADIYLLSAMEAATDAFGDAKLLDGYPHVRKVKEAVLAIPEIKAYIEKRPQ